ncbi:MULTISPECIES: ABC transporter ATP-binding protein [unclassified Caulobacter]|uniref:ABC transporter ATP-binding protein n=1 Tax=unclassified Caulobacter TaxID=2648921 RepID=UPI000D366641|nr:MULTISPECIES: ABC transporter ATP-binding protein [unclassified Caulobacter]PTS84523.1 ABC transporter ATP-binding protein [Caulobacter sp. HMWF009]PTT08763.1 ABC transporter ATP-binding protein [Caulobacter sp. HMWF025]PTT76794.1 ABC transporter ATP-binding protein [Pseudomonas sp. HMWF010]
MTIALEAVALTKAYGSVRALDDFSLSIPAGGVFGVLGPNGAGKSTLFRIALGLVRPTSGSASLFGAPAGDMTSLRKVGAMIETPRYPPYLTARDTLSMLALESGTRDADISGWLDRVGLGGAADRATNGFSVGMKQRLGLAAAFFTRPELVILDEPTSGMDPAGIQEIRALVVDLARKEGVTVILASHQLDEVRRVCDRVAILSKGKVVTEGAVDALTASQVRLRLVASPVEQVLAVLGEKGAADGPDAVLADISRSEAPALIRALVNAGVEITEARWREADLEGVYLQTLKSSGAA